MAEATQERVAAPSEKPPAVSLGALGWLRANLFNGPLNSVLTLLAIYVIYKVLAAIIDWAIVDATWTAASGRDCLESGRGGACWAFIAEKYRFILFGRFPYSEHWRPLIVIFLLLGLVLASCDRRLWNRNLAFIWIGGLVLAGVLMWGGVLGMTFVPTELWGGLPLTVMLAIFGVGFGFPLGILLALGRRSDMPAVRAICIGYIELIRGVPLITVLFMASVMLPLFLPPGTSIDKLLRAQVGFILFTAAYLAEVIRGGLQAIPKGQYEAADALGLGYIAKTRLIILPQALAVVIPPLVNSFISTLKDTSLVLIISLFDLLTTATAAVTDPNWRGFYVEAYVFVGLIYWVMCFFMSKYSQSLERDFAHNRRR